MSNMELRSRAKATNEASPTHNASDAAAERLGLIKKTAKTATGEEVPKDVLRRKEAEAVDAKGGVDRPLQMLCIASLVLPIAWSFATQESPTASEQIQGWARASWNQLTDGVINPDFQVAVAALFIERICYTWVHTFSGSFQTFCDTPIGKMMGSKPLDTVLTIFWINKVIQLGTFVGWYFYVIGFNSPFQSGFAWSAVTRLQWVLLAQGMVAGQGLNIAIYRAIGKRGVYYGHRLGLPAPWVTGFPFSVMPHPQYCGVCFTVIGVNLFVATQTHIESGWFNLTAIQVLFYVYMAMVEDYL